MWYVLHLCPQSNHDFFFLDWSIVCYLWIIQLHSCSHMQWLRSNLTEQKIANCKRRKKRYQTKNSLSTIFLLRFTETENMFRYRGEKKGLIENKSTHSQKNRPDTDKCSVAIRINFVIVLFQLTFEMCYLLYSSIVDIVEFLVVLVVVVVLDGCSWKQWLIFKQM